MTVSDETLMAFADGQLDEPARTEVESAVRGDPQLAARVAQHVALRQRLVMAYSSELSEPVPERLLAAAGRGPNALPGNVVNLKEVRNAKARSDFKAKPLKTWWRAAGTIAASVIIGFALGYANRFQASGIFKRGAQGTVVAGDALAKTLSRQLAADQAADSAIHVGISFLAKNGDYCRTFSLSGSVGSSGLACLHSRQWLIETMNQTSNGDTAAYRTAGSGLSPATLREIEERIDGEPLDAAAEAAALRRGWQK